jgi:hypothetical protein
MLTCISVRMSPWFDQPLLRAVVRSTIPEPPVFPAFSIFLFAKITLVVARLACRKNDRPRSSQASGKTRFL